MGPSCGVDHIVTKNAAVARSPDKHDFSVLIGRDCPRSQVDESLKRLVQSNDGFLFQVYGEPFVSPKSV
mgnify:CR=1 FL=1